jgi:hypothetical protein
MHKGDLYVHMQDEFREAGVDPLDIPALQTIPICGSPLAKEICCADHLKYPNIISW